MHLRPCPNWCSDGLTDAGLIQRNELAQMADFLWFKHRASSSKLLSQHAGCTCVNSVDTAAFVLTALDVASMKNARIKARALHLSRVHTSFFYSNRPTSWDENATLRVARASCFHRGLGLSGKL
jgi:hypothetical protein